MNEVEELKARVNELSGAMNEQIQERRKQVGFYLWLALLQVAVIVVANLLPRAMAWGLVVFAVVIWGFLAGTFLETAHTLEACMNTVTEMCSDVVEFCSQIQEDHDVQD